MPNSRTEANLLCRLAARALPPGSFWAET